MRLGERFDECFGSSPTATNQGAQTTTSAQAQVSSILFGDTMVPNIE